MPDEEDMVPPVCELCRVKMNFIENLPKVGPFPELWTFLCAECGNVQAIEKEDD